MEDRQHIDLMAMDLGLPIKLEISIQNSSSYSPPYCIAVEQSVNQELTSLRFPFQTVPHPVEDDSFYPMFLRYSGTRLQPSPDDDAWIDSFLANNANQISTLKTQIVDLRATILGLCEGIAKLSAAVVHKECMVKTAKSFRSPIRRLPPEILNSIFQWCYDPDIWEKQAASAPLLLCCVCKTWREVAISNPLLWNSHSIDLGRFHDRSNSNSSNFLDVIQARSRGKPLALEITQKPDLSRRVAQPSLKNFMNSILPVFTICHSLRLRISYPTLARIVQDINAPQALFDHLESLILCISGSFGREHPLRMFEDAPSLRIVSLHMQECFDECPIFLPGNPMREFNYHMLGSASYRDVAGSITWRNIIRNCANLEHLRLTLLLHPEADDNFHVGDPRLLDLSHLKTFEIVNELCGDLDSIFENFSYSNRLKRFRFEAIAQPCVLLFYEGNDIASVSDAPMCLQLTTIIPLLQCLTHLTLVQVSLNDLYMLRLFKTTTSLRHLELFNVSLGGNPNMVLFTGNLDYCAPDNRRLLQLLTDGDGEELLLPGLVSLVLYFPAVPSSDNSESPFSPYSTMARTRVEMNASRDICCPGTDNHFKLLLHFFRSGNSSDITAISTAMNSIATESLHFQFDYDILSRFINVRKGCSDNCSMDGI